MFSNIRVVSKRVQVEVPTWLQELLWYLIESMEVTKKDRVQFLLKKNSLHGGYQQVIIHSQQHPFYRKEHIITSNNTVNTHVIVNIINDQILMLMS